MNIVKEKPTWLSRFKCQGLTSLPFWWTWQIYWLRFRNVINSTAFIRWGQVCCLFFRAGKCKQLFAGSWWQPFRSLGAETTVICFNDFLCRHWLSWVFFFSTFYSFLLRYCWNSNNYEIQLIIITAKYRRDTHEWEQVRVGNCYSLFHQCLEHPWKFQNSWLSSHKGPINCTPTRNRTWCLWLT